MSSQNITTRQDNAAKSHLVAYVMITIYKPSYPYDLGNLEKVQNLKCNFNLIMKNIVIELCN